MNIGEWSSKRAHLFPNRLFLKQEDLSCTNKQFDQRVNRVAQAFLGLSVGKGDRVAVLLVNGSAFLEIFFACAKIGAVLVPLNHQLATPELRRIIINCGPKILIYSTAFSAVADQLKATDTPVFFYLPHPEGTFAAVEAFGEPPSKEESGEPTFPWEVALTDPIVIMFTSGTTGSLKGAVLTHQNFLFGAVHGLLSYGINPGTISLVVAPLFHIGALAASALPVIYAGGLLIIRPFDNPSEILHLIGGERINFVFAVPVMFKMLTKAPAWTYADFSHVHFFLAGGAPMPVDLIRKYQEEKAVRFAQGYGMTETQRITALELSDAERKAGSIGKEVFHTKVRIIDDGGLDVAEGAAGELIVKGPTVFDGYWNNPAATTEALRDGWFHTGDLGRRDEEGFLYIVGRKTDLIISSGENIYAAEVENAIEALPQVAEAAVVGMPDTNRGEIAVAFVVLRKYHTLSAEALIGALKGRLASYKVPKRVFFTETLPKTGSGKVHKQEIKASISSKMKTSNT
ncbi:MAG: long-chain fatty acid--CoA ligase [Proteobacteria bacterium]|nr:long-chain fatty acid--CoA ligase [Pseudomonadota bacterium]